jgi:hypothetical protein
LSCVHVVVVVVVHVYLQASILELGEEATVCVDEEEDDDEEEVTEATANGLTGGSERIGDAAPEKRRIRRDRQFDDF